MDSQFYNQPDGLGKWNWNKIGGVVSNVADTVSGLNFGDNRIYQGGSVFPPNNPAVVYPNYPVANQQTQPGKPGKQHSKYFWPVIIAAGGIALVGVLSAISS